MASLLWKTQHRSHIPRSIPHVPKAVIQGLYSSLLAVYDSVVTLAFAFVTLTPNCFAFAMISTLFLDDTECAILSFAQSACGQECSLLFSFSIVQSSSTRATRTPLHMSCCASTANPPHWGCSPRRPCGPRASCGGSFYWSRNRSDACMSTNRPSCKYAHNNGIRAYDM